MKFRKCVTFFVIMFMISIMSNNSYANEIVNISSGLGKSYESTFDTYRVVSGEAKKNSKVVIKHYSTNNSGGKNFNKISVKNIGESRMFTEVLKLEYGKNNVDIIATYQQNKEVLQYVINKKDEKIKEKLGNVSKIFAVDLGK